MLNRHFQTRFLICSLPFFCGMSIESWNIVIFIFFLAKCSSPSNSLRVTGQNVAQCTWYNWCWCLLVARWPKQSLPIGEAPILDDCVFLDDYDDDDVFLIPILDDVSSADGIPAPIQDSSPACFHIICLTGPPVKINNLTPMSPHFVFKWCLVNLRVLCSKMMCLWDLMCRGFKNCLHR